MLTGKRAIICVQTGLALLNNILSIKLRSSCWEESLKLWVLDLKWYGWLVGRYSGKMVWRRWWEKYLTMRKRYRQHPQLGEQMRYVGYLRHQEQVDLWPFDLQSGVRVTCDVGYLCANFSLPRPLYSRLRPDERDRRQTASSLNAPWAEA